MASQVVIPSQIRAGRSLLGWSQEQLAAAAGISISSVRDVESQKRPADSSAVTAIRQTLENAGVIFVTGDDQAGPGVRLTAHRPNLLRRPTVVTKWEGAPFEVEWRGKMMTVFVANEVLEDLDRLTNASHEQLLRSFDRHSGHILDAVVRAAGDQRNFDKHGHLYIRTKDVNDC